MSLVRTKTKYIVIAVLAILVMVLGFVFVHATAASAKITVTNALTNETLYSGDDLQEAFNAAERGSIIYIARSYRVETEIIIDSEVMISGFNLLSFTGDGKFLLTGSGAVYVPDRFKVKRIGALYEYSEIDYSEESGGYVYYLVTKSPSLEGQSLNVSVSNKVLGYQIDYDNGVIYVDAHVDGITVAELKSCLAMEALNADAVAFAVNDTIVIDGKGECVKNGSLLVASATNRDTKTTATASFKVVLLGDVNSNGRIDAADASLIMLSAIGSSSLSDEAMLVADANQDGVVSTADADALCKKYVRSGSYSSPLGNK